MKNYFRQHIYKWHRITSLVIAIPVLLWTISGFMHPVMSSFRPQLMNQSLGATIIDTQKIKLNLRQALEMHKVEAIHQSRIVELYGAFYYQVQVPGKDILIYISCYNGQMLTKGDEQYAAYLAQRYLSDPNGGGNKSGHHGAAADLAGIVKRSTAMNMRRNTPIIEVTLIQDFNSEYKKSNVLLPVYKVLFDRPDNLRLYIEPFTGKLSVAIDDKRAWFTKFFAITHSWSFMDNWGIAKPIIIGMLSLVCLLSSFLGFAVYNIVRKKKAVKNTNSVHRITGNIFVITTMLYAFSGGWHAIHKQGKTEDSTILEKNIFGASNLDFSLTGMIKNLQPGDSMSNLSIVRMKNENYWQLTVVNQGKTMKRYLEKTSLVELKNGDMIYGQYLATRFAGTDQDPIVHSSSLNKFNDSYSMMKKRLPVVQVEFNNGKNYFIETSTGYLSSVADKSDKAERFSFSNLHMHHYWENWFGRKIGKPLKNIFLISTTLGLVLLAITGLIMYKKKVNKKRKMAS